MKKSMLMIVVMFLLCSLFGVNNVGFKGGVNFSNIHGEDVDDDFESKAGFNFGIVAQQRVSQNVRFQEEFLITQKGTKLDYNGYEIVEKYNYLEIPVLIKVKMGNPNSPLSLYGGPSFSFLTSAKNTTTYNGYSVSGSVDDYMNDFDLGINIGADLTMDRFFFDVRYTHGLSNIYKGSDEEIDYSSLKVKNKVIAVGVGFIF